MLEGPAFCLVLLGFGVMGPGGSQFDFSPSVYQTCLLSLNLSLQGAWWAEMPLQGGRRGGVYVSRSKHAGCRGVS